MRGSWPIEFPSIQSTNKPIYYLSFIFSSPLLLLILRRRYMDDGSTTVKL